MRGGSSIAQSAADAASVAAMAGVPAGLRNNIANAAIISQETLLPFPYWSAVLFQSNQAAGPPITQTIPAVDRLAFSYGLNQPMTSAGFTSTAGPLLNLVAAESETNLKNPSQTNDNADVLIYGLALEVDPTSDPLLTQLIFQNTFVQLSLNGSTTYKLGRLANYPFNGGLAGMQRSLLQPAEVISTVAAPEGFVTNGLPLADSLGWFPEDLIFRWYSNGSNERDIALTMNLRLARNVVFTARRAARAVQAASATTQETAAWAMPVDQFQGTWCEIVCKLQAIQIGARSKNS